MSIKLFGDKFLLRTVDVDDAEFIVELRTDEKLARFLSSIESNVEKQKEWISNYKIREAEKQEYYFVTENLDGERLGLSRIYNFQDRTFELGSWIYKRGVSESLPILADLRLRDFAYQELGYEVCKFEVNKGNRSVLKYHLFFKPTLVFDDGNNCYFELTNQDFQIAKQKVEKIFQHGQYK